MGEIFICPTCDNSNPTYLGQRNEEIYCRLCVGFIGEKAPQVRFYAHKVTVTLNYRLSEKQKEIANKLWINYKQGKNSLLHAVTGAGKTEMVLEIIYRILSLGGRVGMAIPRQEVVKELFLRFKMIFPHEKVVAVYGGHVENLVGNVVIFTTHQAYRYPEYFDLLIVDEIDAFPYKGNSHLKRIVLKTTRKNYVFMTATPSEKDLEEIGAENVLYLESRYHKSPLPVPEIKVIPRLFQIFFIIRKIQSYQQRKCPVFVFVPTIKEGKVLIKILKLFLKNGELIYAELPVKNHLINEFKSKKLTYLVTTSIMERGVTLENLQVLIYHSDHSLYQKDTLIQIAGRVGRKVPYVQGEVFFLANKKTPFLQEARQEIIKANESLR